MTDDAAFGDRFGDVLRERGDLGQPVLDHRHLRHELHRPGLGIVGRGHGWSSKHAMSVILPSVSSAQRMRTRVPGAAASGEPESSACSNPVSAPSRVHERPRERPVERMVAQRFGDPRRRRHDTGLGDLDHVAGRVAGVRVVLERRHEHAARGGADTEHAPVPEGAEERADDGPDAAPVGEFELPGGSHRLGSPTGAPAPRQTATSARLGRGRSGQLRSTGGHRL